MMKHFSMNELTRSETAERLGIRNNPDEKVRSRLEQLVENTLDPLREAYGKPINVNSGYRCPRLNKAVGGSANSGHMYGFAADITTGTKKGNRKLWDIVVQNNIPFTKMIDEQGFSWIHISYDADNVKKQKMRATKDSSGRWRYVNA